MIKIKIFETVFETLDVAPSKVLSKRFHDKNKEILFQCNTFNQIIVSDSFNKSNTYISYLVSFSINFSIFKKK